MNITIVGTGYVGLVSGTCFSDTGINVICMDKNQEKINNLKKNILPIYEPGLEAMIRRNVEKGRLLFSTDLKQCLKDCDVIFIAVGTPPDEDGSADLKYIIEVACEIGKLINDYIVVVTKSTVPVGTSKIVKETIKRELKKRNVSIKFDVASNPEFLKEGAAIDDFLKPDRIIIGVDSDKAKATIEKLYHAFLLNGHPLIFMDLASAELTKYAANAMLATKISFMNDIANLCELLGADVNMIRKGIGSDPRIGNKFIYPGIGYGGSCFPKDVKALLKTANDMGYPMEVIKAVEKVNNEQKKILVTKIKHYFKNNIKGKTFGIWGLSFKPNTDDMREAPSLVIINQLLTCKAHIKVYDPVAMNEAKKCLSDTVEYSKDMYEAAIETDGIILVTEWPEFRVPNFKVLGKLMKEKVIFDGRNIYEKKDIVDFGFKLYSIGRN